jgi:hypothetical protein
LEVMAFLRHSEARGSVAWGVVLQWPEREGEKDVQDGLNAQVLSVWIHIPEPLVKVEADLEGEEDVKLAVDSAAERQFLHPM